MREFSLLTTGAWLEVEFDLADDRVQELFTDYSLCRITTA